MMAAMDNRINLLLFVALALFAVSLLLTFRSSASVWDSLIWNTMSALGIYYDFALLGTANNAYVFAADFLDSLVFVLITFYLATWFYNLVRRVDVEERWAMSKIRRLKDHAIIAPYNSLAEFLLKDMKEKGMPAVVIADKQEELARIRREGAMALLGNPGSVDTYKAAGIDRAGFVIACGEDDTKNALVAVTAKSANKRVRVIARARRIEDIARISKAGANRIVVPESSAGSMLGEEIIRRLFYK